MWQHKGSVNSVNEINVGQKEPRKCIRREKADSQMADLIWALCCVWAEVRSLQVDVSHKLNV